MPVPFMRRLFVPLSSISQWGLEFFTLSSSWENDTFFAAMEKTQGGFLLAPAPSAVQRKTMAGGEGGGCSDHPVIHIIPCC